MQHWNGLPLHIVRNLQSLNIEITLQSIKHQSVLDSSQLPFSCSSVIRVIKLERAGIILDESRLQITDDEESLMGFSI